MALITPIVPSSSSFPSSANSPLPSSYDAFISFCGEDTRNGFVDHLYADFQRKGLNVFKDDIKLERGKLIRDELLEAIKQSQYAVVVISENFAFSKWCLIELDKIVECETEKRLKILPVFYRIDPSEVRNQKGIFAQAFAKHKEDPYVGEEQRRAWSSALGKVVNIAGWHVQPIISAEADVVKDITRIILCGVQSNSSKSFEGLVGVGSRVKELENELRLGMDDVRLIGIYGMHGIGKTTLVKALLETVRNEFDANCYVCCGIENRVWKLQQQIVREILGERKLKIQDPIHGTELLKTRVHNKKVFIVLDDVNRYQLEQLVGNTAWFGQGSRIVLIGKDRQLLKPYVNKTYEVKPLGDEDAFELFCRKAFKNFCPEPGYLELVKNIIRQVNGHPLAIAVIGSSLFGKGEGEWIGVRDVLEVDSKGEILTKLKISYEMLADSLKKYFLDIACFGGWFVDILKLFDPSTSLHIGALEDNSLINTSRFGGIVMHDLLRKLGQQVVYQMSPLEPGNRSRLWVSQDIIHVLRSDSGTEAIEGIIMRGGYPRNDYSKDRQVEVNYESFFRMTRLTVLILLFGDFFYLKWIGNPSKLVLSNELRVIRWVGFPLKSLPDRFQSDVLVELWLQDSNIKVLWIGKKSFGQLKNIDLRGSKYLTETPDFSGVPNLEELWLSACERLRKIHPSIANLGKLELLILNGCRQLRDDVTSLLPLDSRKNGIRTSLLASLESLSSLSVLDLSGCSNFLWRPSDFDWFSKTDPSYSCELIGSHPHSWLTALTSITYLNLSDCNLSDGDIPNDISCLSLLEHLNLSKNGFTRIPEGIAQLSKLMSLNMCDCQLLQSMYMLPPSCFNSLSYPLSYLEKFVTHKCHLFQSLSNLKHLYLYGCSGLRTLPIFPLALTHLNVKNCPLLEMDYCQIDVRDIPLRMGVWFSVATEAGYDGTPYKILQLNPHVSGEAKHYDFFNGELLPWGPTLAIEIPGWFNFRGINHLGKIQCGVDVDSHYEKEGLALFLAYKVYEREHSNCSISGGTNTSFPKFVLRFQAPGNCEGLSLVFRVPEAPFVGPNGFWAYLPYEFFWPTLWGVRYFETSIETSNSNVKVKECGARLVYEHNISEFFDVLNSITPHGLELKNLDDFRFGVSAGKD